MDIICIYIDWAYGLQICCSMDLYYLHLQSTLSSYIQFNYLGLQIPLCMALFTADLVAPNCACEGNPIACI